MPYTRPIHGVVASPLALLALGCLSPDEATAPEPTPAPTTLAAVTTPVGFSWGSATPESQGKNNAPGASYLTLNGCQPGWTGTAPTCTAGKDFSNNWGGRRARRTRRTSPRV